jgi:uncharacterized protein (TIGR03437 family)
VCADRYYEIATVAGSERLGDGGAAVAAQLSQPEGLALDGAGNLYIADPDSHRVRRVTPGGIITTVAGIGHAGFRGDAGPAAQARLNAPYGVAADAQGNIYIADTYNHRIRRVTPAGEIRTIAGTGAKGSSGDSGLASAASLATPRNVALDAAGNLYISEFDGHRVRRISPDGIIATVAGTGVAGFNADGIATAAQISSPAGLAADPAGAIYITDVANARVRRLRDGMLITVYGPLRTANGSRYPAAPAGVACDRWGNVFVAERETGMVLRLMPSGDVVPVAAPNGLLWSPRDVTADATGLLYVSGDRRVRKLVPNGGLINFAGDGTFGFGGDHGPAAEARFHHPRGIARDRNGELYIADAGNQRVRHVDGAGFVQTVAGGGTAAQDGAIALHAALKEPTAVGFDSAGNLLIGDTGTHRLRRLTGNVIAAVAGNGQIGMGLNAGPALSISLKQPGKFALDRAGSIYLADTGNHRVIKVTTSGVASVFAGNGVPGYSGDGGLAMHAHLHSPAAVAVDEADVVYIADTGNQRVRRVNVEGIISTVIGEGAAGAGDARLDGPCALAMDGSALVMADSTTVRRWSGDTLETIAGSGGLGFDGDGGPALEAKLNYPCGLATDADGRIWIADSGNHRIRVLTPRMREVRAAPLEKLTVLHGASLREGAVAPGQVVSIPGAGAAAEVTFDGAAARVILANETRVDVLVPSSVGGKATTLVELRQAGKVHAAADVPVATAAPALFTVAGGAGQALAHHHDGSLNSAANPAPKGSYVTLYATGEGIQPQALMMTIGGQPAEVAHTGAAPGLPGIIAISVRMPGAFSPGGVLEAVLSVGAASSPPGITIVVK